MSRRLSPARAAGGICITGNGCQKPKRVVDIDMCTAKIGSSTEIHTRFFVDMGAPALIVGIREIRSIISVLEKELHLKSSLLLRVFVCG